MSAPCSPAELIWCLVCAAPVPFEAKQIEPPSRQHLVDYDGDRLVCRRCATTLASVYARVVREIEGEAA